ncbi:MAG: hypothetical protein ACKVU4_14010 [Phycisphaerales bacterium]
MARTVLHLLLIVAVTLGSPAAACCRLAAVAHHAGFGGSVHAAGASVEAVCSCCEQSPDSPAPGPHEPGKPCDCGSGTSLLIESNSGKTFGAWSAAPLFAPAVIELVRLVSRFTPAPERERPPPDRSLFGLHCLLTV